MAKVLLLILIYFTIFSNNIFASSSSWTTTTFKNYKSLINSGLSTIGFSTKEDNFWKTYSNDNLLTISTIGDENKVFFRPFDLPVLQSGSKYILPIIPYPLSRQSGDTLDFFLNGIKRDFPASTQKVRTGFSVGMPYLNFVKGTNYDFDSTFLNEELSASINQKLPILIDLNGHRYTYEPNYLTLINNLSQDPTVFMHNQDSIPISQLSEWQNPVNRPGSDLWSLNVFNSRYRLFKKKNIQQAGQIISEFASNHPELFAGVSLDSEISFCPSGFQTVYNFDFNPDTLVQYRMWLAGSSGEYQSPDPAKYTNPYLTGGVLVGKGKNLKLSDVNIRYGTSFSSWNLVNPPKSQVNTIQPIEGTNATQWQDWLTFKSSLTNEMLNTTKQWLADVGIPKNLIFSHQPIYTDTSPTGAYAFCGISFDSGILTDANYGITTYVDLTHYDSVLANIQRISPIWGIFEWNPLSASSQSVEAMLNTAFVKNKALIVSPNFYLPRRTGDINTTYNIYDNPAILEGINNFVGAQN